MGTALASFAGKRVLVTGHTGFKGSWLSFLLTELGAEVMGLALPPPPGPNHFDLLQLQDRMSHVTVDIREPEPARAAVQSFEPEYVFHLAAQALVTKSYREPAVTFGSNVMGSVHVLEAIRQCEAVRSLVYVTSDKCYENVEWVWGYRENDRLGGHDPYSASKAAAEIVFSAYDRSFFTSRTGLGAATARAGNVVGGGDWAADRIVPDCVRAAERQSHVQLRNPLATRPWQHVLEPISGYLLLAAALRDNPSAYGGSWNFGPSTANVRTVQEVADGISAALGLERAVPVPSTRGVHEAQLLQLNCDKAHQLLNWFPRWDVDKTIDATAQWYRALRDGQDARDITAAQIRDYFPELR